MAIAGQQNRVAVELAVRTKGRIKTVPFTIQTKPVFDGTQVGLHACHQVPSGERQSRQG
ncbi:hypothetical protein GCM10009552_20730 [Rothia nasimurium]